VSAGDGLVGAGFCETTRNDRYFANSPASVWAATIRARLWMPSSGYLAPMAGRARTASLHLFLRFADLDGEALGRHAAARARSGADPIELPPGRYEVVLEARCVAYLMDFFTFYGFNGRAVTRVVRLWHW